MAKNRWRQKHTQTFSQSVTQSHNQAQFRKDMQRRQCAFSFFRNKKSRACRWIGGGKQEMNAEAMPEKRKRTSEWNNRPDWRQRSVWLAGQWHRWPLVILKHSETGSDRHCNLKCLPNSVQVYSVFSPFLSLSLYHWLHSRITAVSLFSGEWALSFLRWVLGDDHHHSQLLRPVFALSGCTFFAFLFFFSVTAQSFAAAASSSFPATAAFPLNSALFFAAAASVVVSSIRPDIRPDSAPLSFPLPLFFSCLVTE